MLTYRRLENLELVGYDNEKFGKAEDDYISSSGFLFKMAGAAVAWKSARQSCVSSSTMFSEYIACYEATSITVWLRNFLLKTLRWWTRFQDQYRYTMTILWLFFTT